MTELLDRWYGVSYVSWAPTTARSVRSIIDQQLVPGIGEVLVRELTAVTIDELYSRLRVSGRTDGKALSVGSVRRVHAVLHRALAQAMRWEWIWTNPAALASPPRSEPVEMRPPTPHDVAVLLAHTAEADPLLHLFVVLAATTGARRGQLLAALRWTDIDLETASISFQRALVEGPSGPVLVPTKTRRSHRVALDPGTSALLAAWLAGIAHAQAEVRDRFIFCYDEDGTRPRKPNYVTKRFIRSRKAAGLGHFRLHDLRHFMATQMLDVGVAVPIVAARLAHARASTTLNVYAHAVPGGDRHAAQQLSRLLAEVMSASPAKLKANSAQSDVGAAR
jgi:integrase